MTTLESLKEELMASIIQLHKELNRATHKSVSWYSLSAQLNTRKYILRRMEEIE